MRCLTLLRVTAYSFVEGFFAPSADWIVVARVWTSLRPRLNCLSGSRHEKRGARRSRLVRDRDEV
jgi:hypothetical protein